MKQHAADEFMIESVTAKRIVKQFGTPCYVYSKQAIEQNWLSFDRAFADKKHTVCFAVKACSNLTILNLLAKLGSGFDIVSGGELTRVLKAGGDPSKIIFSGVGKSEQEILLALDVGIRCFNIESEAEFIRIERLAKSGGKLAPISVRVNPDIDAKTHPYISTGLKENKFGVDVATALKIYQQAHASDSIEIKGIDCHVGSQMTTVLPIEMACEKILETIQMITTQGIIIHEVNMGGGFGIPYYNEAIPKPAVFIDSLLKYFTDTPYEIVIEPGRSIVGPSGYLLTMVEYIKSQHDKNFAIVDAAMNDLLRPALYQGWHDIVAVDADLSAESRSYDIVGPVCESTDCLGTNRTLQISAGDLLCIKDVGAYGSSMGSNYNSRPFPPEILVDGENFYEIRKRQDVEDLFRYELFV